MATCRILTTDPDDSRSMATRHRDTEVSRPFWRRLERLLWAAALLSLGYFGYVSAEARLYQAYEDRELDAIFAAARASVAGDAEGGGRPARTAPPPGSTLGRIEIPRLRISTVIRAEVDARTLRLAVGHIPGTALPGEAGNIGVAGHRDTFFRRLRHIRAGDAIRIVTRDGTFAFRVQDTRVVRPRDTWVLHATPDPTLTLVTCYPFTFIGSAPQRFIVRAVARNPPGADLRPPRG
ncbi:MAG: class D sortase [Acidobacteria bacterium]|nr:class D sortase [Acidobacteriota bacterium]